MKKYSGKKHNWIHSKYGEENNLTVRELADKYNLNKIDKLYEVANPQKSKQYYCRWRINY